MSGLLAYIDQRHKTSRNADDAAKTRSQEKESALASALRAFSGDATDIDLLSLLSPRWQDEFRHYLQHTYTYGSGKHLTESTITDYLSRLRAVARDAIKEGILPNIKLTGLDPFPAVEIKGRKVQSSTLADIGRLLKYMPADPTKRQALDYYLLSLMLCGIPLGQLLSMPKSHYADGRLRLPHLHDITVALNHTLEVLLRRNAGGADSPLLFGYLSPDDDETQRSHKLRSLRSDIISLTTSLHLSPALRSVGLFSAWLDAALPHMACADIKRVITARLYPHIPVGDDLPGAIAQTIATIAADKGNIVATWYAVRCLNKSATRVVEMLYSPDPQDRPMKRLPFEATYAPQDIHFRKKGSQMIRYNNPAVDRLLFIRGTMAEMKAIQSMLWGEAIFYTESSTADGTPPRYTQIPDAEIDNLKRFLRETDENRLYRQEVKAVGKKVRVIEGMYRGCEGIIVEYEGSTPKGMVDSPSGVDSRHEPITYFAVRLMGNSFIMTPSVEATMVEEII